MAGRPSSSSSSRARSSSPFGYRKPPSTSYSSSSSSTSFINGGGRLIPRSSPSSVSSHFHGSGMPRSSTPNHGRSDPSRNRAPVPLPTADELIVEPADVSSRGGDSISVTVRFRPLSEREFQRGDEIAWHADGDKIVRSKYNPATAYGFDRVFGPATSSKAVYDVAARPVVKAAMEGINGTVFAYGVTSSGKTHTMHGDQKSPGIIPLAIKDVFSIIQDTPGREFLLRVSYLEIYNEVISDLLDPTGQNLRVREDAQGTYVEGIKEEVVLSPGHALSFIAAGEEHRHVGSNNFNLFSSRSHTIFTLLQIQNLEREIQGEKRQMRTLEQRITESGEASMANASLVDMQQTVMKLMTQCSEMGFELELKTADNRILQEQLQQKCAENNELQEKVLHLQEQLNSMKTNMQSSSTEQVYSTEIDDLKGKSRSQEAENNKLSQERLQLIEENRGLLSQKQKLAEEASYAKELASAVAVELKNLAEEVTKLSLENARQANELLVAQEMAYSRGGIRKNEGTKLRRNRPAGRGGEFATTAHDDVECLNVDFDEMKMELQARKQREAALEAALAEKELLQEEYKRKFNEAKKRETALENDLAGM